MVTEALAVAGVDADEISYIETHGTGTLIGDPIEVAGLTQAFRATTARKGYCAIGSVKSNVGHTGEAAGVAASSRRCCRCNTASPAQPVLRAAESAGRFPEQPVFRERQAAQLASRGQRRAGVTGLGAGGTNAHIIVEEAPARDASPAARGPQLLVLSAKSEAALERATDNLAEHLTRNPALNLADVAHTLRVGRVAFSHRRFLVADSVAEAATVLRERDQKRLFSQVVRGEAASVVFMFPGGGAQYPGMGRDLYSSERVYREALDACLAHVQRRLGHDLKPLLFPAPADVERAAQRLLSPSLALPALFSTSYALAKLLMSWEVLPSAMIGHSAGEYVAACLAGVFTFEQGLELVGLRGRLFETLPKGAMLSMSLSAEQARAYMGPELSFAAINAPELSVASGPSEAIAELERTLLAARSTAPVSTSMWPLIRPCLSPSSPSSSASAGAYASRAPRSPMSPT